MKVWIVTARFGQGHFSAAKALEEEYKSKGYEVIVSDIIEVLYPILARWIYGVFNHVICRNAVIYNFLNDFGRKPRKNDNQKQRIKEVFTQIQPDVIVTTWSACARMLGPLPVPMYVCITDLGVHEGWVSPHVQGYFAATHDVAKRLNQMGVPKEKIQIQGIPVKKAFHGKIKKQKSSNKILIVGGGLGILPWVDELLTELQAHPEIDITVIAGKNQKLCKKLKQKYPSVTVLGFTKEVPRYLLETDLLILKPGGVSLFESIYMQTPCVAVFPAYKHELDNAAFIQKNEIGAVVRQGESAGECVLDLMKNEDARLKYQLNMKKMIQHLDTMKGEGSFVIKKNH